jgi:hypothetical protein
MKQTNIFCKKSLDETIKNQTNIFLKTNKNFQIFLSYTYKSFTIIINITGVYIMWMILHYLSTHIYTELCVPKTITGFFISPFLTTMPHCQCLRWVVYNGGNVINHMWVVIGTWLFSYIMIFTKEIPNLLLHKSCDFSNL